MSETGPGPAAGPQGTEPPHLPLLVGGDGSVPCPGSVSPWWRRSLDRLVEFLQAVLQPATRAERRRRRALPGPSPLALPAPRVLVGGDGAAAFEPPVSVGTCGVELPFDLLLTSGHGAVPLFQAGPIDELAFFQHPE